jgi:tRNA threonylcarbamoyladenosine biosynthesis protein TsaB
MNVVAFDTAGPVIGVALCTPAGVSSRRERVARGAESRLVPWAVELCEEVGLDLRALGGVAVTDGPGAFTGLRVGLATASGLAMALSVPLWTAMSLRPRAELARGDSPVLAMLDARKSRVYAALYSASGALVAGPADVDPAVALGWTGPGFVATGEGALVYADAVQAVGGRVAEGADSPCVEQLAVLAAAGLARGEGAPPWELRPRYLREPDARPPRR